MNTSSPTVTSGSIEERLNRLATLDLTNVRRKLMEPLPEGQAWDMKCCEAAEKWYKRFLTLFIKHPGRKIVPNAMIDAIWHQHILDTRAYAADCERIFGTFIHHHPYFGMNGDSIERDLAFARTNELYEAEFGENPLHLGSKALECATGCGWVDSAADSRPTTAGELQRV